MTFERRQGPPDRRITWRGGRRAMDHQRGPTVLVVDDHADSRELVAAVLGSAALGAAEASTCAAALERMGQSPLPCMVILDLQLPDGHGTDLIRAIKGNPTTASTPILVLSALVGAANRRAAFDAGADGFLAKPILPNQILDAVQRVLPDVCP
jgi:CheY-like chemotaxis protein